MLTASGTPSCLSAQTPWPARCRRTCRDIHGSILASAAVSAPEVLTKLVAPTLDSFAELGEDERQVLFETFRVWVDNGGSLRATGELLFCHTNTVRYRMRRIEERTGRSLSQPR